MDKRKLIKDGFFLFKNIDEKQVEEILSLDGICESKYLQGEIIQNCSHCDKVGIIVKGKAVVRSGVDGVIINRLVKNDVYGAAALFDKPTYSTIVQATSDCTVITMDKSFIKKCFDINSTTAENYIEFLANKISFLNKKINAFTAKSAENKLYSYLLQMPRDGNVLELNVDMSTIAKMIGIGRATLYRSFEKLEKAGTITKNDRIIIFNEV